MDTGTYGYEATPVSATNFDTLVTGPGGSALVGIYTHPDGVQEMVETFNQNQYQLQAELLRHGALAWATRGVFFGDQRNYLETHIDDNFLSDDSWSVAGNATTAAHSTDFNPADALREVPADVTTAANWSKANNFRIDMLFNGGGSVAVANGDSLVGAGDSGSGTTGSSRDQRRHRDRHRSAARRASRRPTPRPASRIRTTSAGSTTPGITRTSTRAARPRTTSRPSSTRTPTGARRQPSAGNPITGGLGSDAEHRSDRRAGQREPERDHHRRALGAGEPAPGQSRAGRPALARRRDSRRPPAARWRPASTSTRSATSSTPRRRARRRCRDRRVGRLGLLSGHRRPPTAR